MKRLTMLLCLIALVFVFVGSSFATQYTVTLAEGSKSVSISSDCQIIPELHGGNDGGPGVLTGQCSNGQAPLTLYTNGSIVGAKQNLQYSVSAIYINDWEGWWYSNSYYKVTVFYPEPD